jgi:putative restriction endonuclease
LPLREGLYEAGLQRGLAMRGAVIRDLRFDREIRTAAFNSRLPDARASGPLAAGDLARGLLFRGERIPLVNPQRGIFKPQQMKYLLPIMTVVPSKGANAWYDDQGAAHDQIYQSDATIEYSFMGANPETVHWRDVRWGGSD